MASSTIKYPTWQRRLAKLIVGLENVYDLVRGMKLERAFQQIKLTEPSASTSFDKINLVVLVVDSDGVVLAQDHHGAISPFNISIAVCNSLRPFRQD
jgi:hypothetical protein